MIGCVSAKGPQLRYAESGTPCCNFVLEVDEVTNGKVYTTYIPCEIIGKYAEQTSVEVEAGDEVHITGQWKYRRTADQTSGAKVSKPVVSSWGVSQRIPALATPLPPAHEASPEYGGGVDEGALPTQAPRAPRRRPYPKAALDGGFQ